MNKSKPGKILIIIQRANGDVLLSSPLIDILYEYYDQPKIDLLVNENTAAVAKALRNVSHVHIFSYKNSRLKETITTISKIRNKYDLSISLTASDRCILFSILSGKTSISATEKKVLKSWWKRILLSHSYFYDPTRHIVINNTASLSLLGIHPKNIKVTISHSENAKKSIHEKLKKLNIQEFLLFHPSAQYEYKIYPAASRTKLLCLLNTLNIPIIVTGGKSELDDAIKQDIPDLDNIHNFIGETTLQEYVALSNAATVYIGSDTLNMHIAASQNKRIFAIFGPTLLQTWSPWSNELQTSTASDRPVQTYGNITIFQADMPCVACGLAGCDDKHGKSDCLYHIDPSTIFNEVQKWLKTSP
ncbi:MAG: glycosyltransferase family 9 protein [Chlorobium phaeobacteroides]|uniref:Glycosyl transferase family 9 n=1 Tax=Chlorobium phaeobacteroides (strain BS1) TaxID=331678 RepID=B3ELM7_CHLPB|nr:glycosyltransferase family 9 protein [Chlorobium phaeobacteroides]